MIKKFKPIPVVKFHPEQLFDTKQKLIESYT